MTSLRPVFDLPPIVYNGNKMQQDDDGNFSFQFIQQEEREQSHDSYGENGGACSCVGQAKAVPYMTISCIDSKRTEV